MALAVVNASAGVISIAQCDGRKAAGRCIQQAESGQSCSAFDAAALARNASGHKSEADGMISLAVGVCGILACRKNTWYSP